eukprot:SAG31_NODE_36980_length_308_cov_1.028708_1_plen_60_part_01
MPRVQRGEVRRTILNLVLKDRILFPPWLAYSDRAYRVRVPQVELYYQIINTPDPMKKGSR